MSGNKQGTKLIKWDESKIRVAFLLALMGATDMQMAEIMQVSINTINWWKRERPEFRQALSEGKIGADTKVLESFYQSAVGYDYEEEIATYDRSAHQWVKSTVKRHRPSDAWAAARWLSIRQRALWSETQKVEVTHNNTLNININNYTEAELKFLEILANKELPPNEGGD
jgi:hypothetical protein